jgi:hypothetical protein
MRNLTLYVTLMAWVIAAILLFLFLFPHLLTNHS